MSQQFDFPRVLPEFRPFLAHVPKLELNGPPSETIRPMFKDFLPQVSVDPKDATVTYFDIKGGQGNDKLNVLSVKPVNAQSPLPVVLGVHGGGYVAGIPAIDLGLYRDFAKAGFHVLSPDYRLAPEAVAPASLNDVEALFEYIVAHPEQYDVGRIALWGCSAGATLAAGLAIRLNNRKHKVQPRFVMLDSPALDDRLIYPHQQSDQFENLKPYELGPRDSYKWMLDHYLGGMKEEDISVELFPLRSTKSSELAGLPPHFIFSNEIDTLVEHGPAYALKLLAADVPVELRLSRATIHSFISILPDSEIAKEGRQEYVKQTRRALA